MVDNGSKYVLAAEDDAFAQNIIKMHLNGLKLKFDIVEDGNKAVDQYKAKDGKIDLILMDIHMPDCDGYSATTQIRQYEKAKGLPACKIYACSADDDAQTQQNVKNCGMNGLLKKPINKNIISAHLN